jgi:pimeloyl-ACP methyl ester carboxylesterase
MNSTAESAGADTIVLVRSLADAAQLGEVDRALRGQGLQRDRPRLARHGRRHRADPEQHEAVREPGRRRDRRPLRAVVRGLDKPPIIIGHSFGGLIAEVLLDRGLGAVGVAISPAPIKGILTLLPSSLKVASVVLKNPGNRHKAVALTPKEFHYGFTNTLSAEESRRAYERYAIPGPGRVLFQAAFSNFAPGSPLKVHPENDKRAPLLLWRTARITRSPRR